MPKEGSSTSYWRWSDARFLLILLLPLLVGAGVLHDPAVVAAHSLIGFAAFALIDSYWPGASRSPAPLAQPNPVLHWILRLYVPAQLVLIAVGAWAASRADGWGVVSLAVGVGLVTGSQGITLAHELGHSRAKFDRVLAWVLMTSVAYAHFMVEHYRGHHVLVATEADPASARRGESLWRFLPRTLVGSWRSAWRLEALRLQRFGLPRWRSPLVWTTAVYAVLVTGLIALGTAGAAKVLVFWLVQAAVAVWLLEAVNYIEHYGLVRAEIDGQREAFGVQHAWNADHVMANSLLANLQRHSDHHMHAWKPWPTLEALPGPQLPGSYAVCVTIAAIPAWWFAAMNPRLDALDAP